MRRSNAPPTMDVDGILRGFKMRTFTGNFFLDPDLHRLQNFFKELKKLCRKKRDDKKYEVIYLSMLSYYNLIF